MTDYSHSEVLLPAFHLASTSESSVPYRDLHLQTFQQSPLHPDRWIASPASQWPLLARIFTDRIIMYPVFTNPHAQRYLDPRHGRFASLVLHDDDGGTLPESADEAVSTIEGRLPRLLFNDCAYGLGLDKDLDAVWLGLSEIRNVDVIGVRERGVTAIEGNVAWVAVDDLQALRRAFGRTVRAGREQVRLVKKGRVRNSLLATLDPERFSRIVQVGPTGQLVEVRYDRSRSSTRSDARVQRRATVRAVRDNLPVLAQESPAELLQLRAEIERVTLQDMIERYEQMLQRTLSEADWQRFFENNMFVLTMLFARPVRLLHTQFHAQGSGLDGSGAQVGDFLFAEQGPGLALVEIKKPSSPLMLDRPYRNQQVFGPHADLSGAVTQVLYQRSALHTNWWQHQGQRPELRESHPDAIKCVVVAGTSPAEDAKRRSFDVFRNACKDVEVVTFDELLGKLRLLLQHLTPVEPEVPF
ncbi:DUF4263 domain-containing protein (plasmid) [Ralstonia solanacearum]|nr:DUF4263 domain-containing protein [Ralstonia solanacearum]